MAKKSKINIEVTLDDKNIPENIKWSAEDAGEAKQDTKSISIGIWDEKKKDTLMLDLWTDNMSMEEMKQFHVNLLGSSASTLLSATGDEFMSSEISNLCEKLVKYLNEK
jgi:gliding motility-associated protein GldC